MQSISGFNTVENTEITLVIALIIIIKNDPSHSFCIRGHRE